jgi:hypothetical protein
MVTSPAHDRAFFICKEFLMTERTYKKDLEVIADHLRRELLLVINQQNDYQGEEEQCHLEHESLRELSDLLFTHLVPICNFHGQFLRQLEQRISLW